MKKLWVSVAGLVMLASAPAWGQAKNFEGLSVGMNVNATNSTLDISYPGFSGSTSASDASASMQLQYNFVPSETLVLGVGLDLGLSQIKVGSLPGNDYKFKNLTSLYAVLGTPVSKDSLVYAKLSSNSLTAEDGGGSHDFNGYGFGLGFQNNLNKNLYWQLGYDQVNFSSYDPAGSSFKPKYSAFTLGLGYRF